MFIELSFFIRLRMSFHYATAQFICCTVLFVEVITNWVTRSVVNILFWFLIRNQNFVPLLTLCLSSVLQLLVLVIQLYTIIDEFCCLSLDFLTFDAEQFS